MPAAGGARRQIARQVRPRAGRGRAPRRRRDRRRRRDAGVPGHGHRHGQADRGASRRASRTTSSTSPTRRGLRRRPLPARRPRGARRHRGARRAGACSSGAPGLYLRAVVDQLEIPGQYPRARDARGRGRHRGAAPAPGRRSTRSRPRHGAVEPPARRARARGHASAAAGRSRRSVPGSTSTALDAVATRRGRQWLARCSTRASTPATTSRWTPALLDEVRALRRPSGCRAPPARPSATRSCIDHVEGAAPSTDALAIARQRTRRFARRQERWFRRDPRIRWIDGRSKTRPVEVDVTSALLDGSVTALRLHRSTRVSATTSSSPCSNRGAASASTPSSRAASAHRRTGVGADGLILGMPSTARAASTCVMHLWNADGSTRRDQRQRHPLPGPGRGSLGAASSRSIFASRPPAGDRTPSRCTRPAPTAIGRRERGDGRGATAVRSSTRCRRADGRPSAARHRRSRQPAPGVCSSTIPWRSISPSRAR